MEQIPIYCPDAGENGGDACTACIECGRTFIADGDTLCDECYEADQAKQQEGQNQPCH